MNEYEYTSLSEQVGSLNKRKITTASIEIECCLKTYMDPEELLLLSSWPSEVLVLFSSWSCDELLLLLSWSFKVAVEYVNISNVEREVVDEMVGLSISNVERELVDEMVGLST